MKSYAGVNHIWVATRFNFWYYLKYANKHAPSEGYWINWFDNYGFVHVIITGYAPTPEEKTSNEQKLETLWQLAGANHFDERSVSVQNELQFSVMKYQSQCCFSVNSWDG